MASDDAWRQRLAEERLGDSLTPGFARAVPRGTVRDTERGVGVIQMAPRAQPPLAPASIPRDTRAAPQSAPAERSAAIPWWWLGAAVLALAGAALLGWYARGSRVQPVVVASTTARPAAAAPVAIVPPAPVAVASGPAPESAVPTASEKITASKSKPGSVRRAATVRYRTARAPRLHHASLHALSPAAARPRFLCRRADNVVTNAICRNPTLGALDRNLTHRFARREGTASPAEARALDRDQTAFLNARQTCRSDACVERLYRRRAVELGGRPL